MDKTICIFGDSVVHASFMKVGWVDLFRQYLEKKYPNDSIEIYNLGISGNTSEDILKRFEAEILARDTTSIIIAVGVNDSGYIQDPSNPIVRKEQFALNLKKLVDTAFKYTQDITFIGLVLGDDSILQPFPGSSSGKAYRKDLVETYDEIIKKVAEKNSCKYI